MSTESSLPLVSVLMTVFNAEDYLVSSIESICEQTLRDLEFIIVDDASTDHSLEIAEAYAARDHRIRVISNSVNKGQTHCLNQGLHEARGRWIARQDADDLSLPQRLEKQIAIVTQYPQMALIGSCGYMIDDAQALVGLLDVPLRQEVIYWSSPLLNPFLHTAVLFNADVVRFLGGYDPTYRIAQDYDLWCRIMAAGYEVSNLSERLIAYRHLSHSLSKKNQEESIQEMTMISQRVVQEVFQDLLSREEKNNLYGWRSCKKEKSFWKLYQKLSSFLPQENILIRKDHARFTAVLHLNVAGRCSGVSRLVEILTACLADTSFVLRWIWERYIQKIFE